MKQPNQEGKPSAEAVEGRRQPEENDAQSNIQPTQRGAVRPGIKRQQFSRF
jgi:hypothetical protein